MAPNSRRFSEIMDDSSEMSIGVFVNSRSSTGSTQDINYKREPKRRKTSGLNARFDNMVSAMNATYSGTRNLRQRQTRTRSSSDASQLSSAIADVYRNLHEDRIGEDFTLIKMQPLMDSHRLVGTAEQIKMPDSRSPNRTENTPSVREAIPEWLRSTFSTLTAKHPLRLLLPKKSPCPRTDANDQNGSDDSKIDPTFAFNPNQINETMTNDRAVDFIGSTSDGYMFLSSTVPRSTTSLNVDRSDLKDNTQKYRSSSATNGVRLPLMLDDVPFSTPGPNIVPVPQHSTTSKMSEMNEQDLNLPSEFEALAFIPFSTPGPASGLQSASTSTLSPRFDLYAPDCLADMDTKTCACSPGHLTSSLLLTSASDPISHSRHTSNELSAIDFCLPPYHAAPSDPAPAYSSDGIYDDTYYADSLTDVSGSERREIPQRTDDNLDNVFVTPGPGYFAPRPMYFDSPTEEPSDPGHPEPGCKIDLNVIDFKWTPFNRKSTEEKKPASDCVQRSDSCQNPVPRYGDHSESGMNCTVTSRTGSPRAGLLPESLPSPSPFRFDLHQLTANVTLQKTTSDHTEPQIRQSTKPAQPFAPAPGIFVSPLREKQETQVSALRTPLNKIIRTELRGLDLDAKAEFPSSRGSHDSIQSWRDVDEDCPSQN